MEPLTDAQRAELAEDLRTLQAQLRAVLEVSEDASRPVDLESPIGRVSRMDAIQQQKMSAAGREANKVRLSQVGRALGALDREEYGDCAGCGEPIGFRRLKVKPEAPFCIECQGRRER